MSTNPELSVVAPLLNEDGNLPELQRRLTAVLQGLGLSYEILYVDDGSTDGSVEILREIARTDEHVVVVVLSRNFGHQIALTAGLDHARGDGALVTDSDLQDRACQVFCVNGHRFSSERALRKRWRSCSAPQAGLSSAASISAMPSGSPDTKPSSPNRQ